jgi:hypothetical protein
MAKFGPIFEQYLARGLSHASLEFIPESELARMLPSGSQLVDYTILGKEGSVLIDAKAVDVPDIGMISHKSEVVADKLKSVFKAIEQGFEVAHLLRTGSLIGASCSIFLLVVTYRDLLLGAGSEFYEALGRRRIDQFAQAYGGAHPIPMNQVFFLSINDFDLLMEHLKAAIPGGEFLRSGRKNKGASPAKTGLATFALKGLQEF